jgi:hypothetical protein
MRQSVRARCFDEYDYEGKPVSMAKLGDTWLPRFSRLLAQGANASSKLQIFDKVSFIIFNYDRCVEQYFTSELRFYWNKSLPEAAEVVKNLDIVHPYGTLGDNWLDGEGRFGAAMPRHDDGAKRLLGMASSLQTYSEFMEKDSAREKAKRMVQQAERLVLLGFGFHEQNLELLRPDTKSNVSEVFSTAYGISSHSRGAINGFIQYALASPVGYDAMRIAGPEVGCAAFFDEFEFWFR